MAAGPTARPVHALVPAGLGHPGPIAVSGTVSLSRTVTISGTVTVSGTVTAWRAMTTDRAGTDWAGTDRAVTSGAVTSRPGTTRAVTSGVVASGRAGRAAGIPFIAPATLPGRRIPRRLIVTGPGVRPVELLTGTPARWRTVAAARPWRVRQFTWTPGQLRTVSARRIAFRRLERVASGWPLTRPRRLAAVRRSGRRLQPGRWRQRFEQLRRPGS